MMMMMTSQPAPCRQRQQQQQQLTAASRSISANRCRRPSGAQARMLAMCSSQLLTSPGCSTSTFPLFLRQPVCCCCAASAALCWKFTPTLISSCFRPKRVPAGWQLGHSLTQQDEVLYTQQQRKQQRQKQQQQKQHRRKQQQQDMRTRAVGDSDTSWPCNKAHSAPEHNTTQLNQAKHSKKVIRQHSGGLES